MESGGEVKVLNRTGQNEGQLVRSKRKKSGVAARSSFRWNDDSSEKSKDEPSLRFAVFTNRNKERSP